MRKSLFFIAFAVLAGLPVRAADFGLLLSPSGSYVSGLRGDGFGFSAGFTPWFSVSFGENTSVYLSGKITLKGFEYSQKAWEPLVELERTELGFRPAGTVYLTLGRQRFGDGPGMLASGLFDGLAGTFGLGTVRLSGGVYYTGWLYKGAAEILMTQRDRTSRAQPLDYGDFFNTYPASSRMLVSFAGDFPDLSSRTSLGIGVLAQFDLNGGDAPLHSQYLNASYGIEAADALRLTVTGVGGLVENAGKDPALCLAAALGADWEIPGATADMLSAELRWGSGAVSTRVVPFLPVTSITQGFVFTPTLSGTMNARISYAVRPLSAFSFSAAAVVFGRTDVETFGDTELDGASKNRYLGAEFYGQLVWAPESVLHFSGGGGVFFPGGAFREDARPRWNVNAGLVLAL
jgi:hypothetical protein